MRFDDRTIGTGELRYIGGGRGRVGWKGFIQVEAEPFDHVCVESVLFGYTHSRCCLDESHIRRRQPAPRFPVMAPWLGVGVLCCAGCRVFRGLN